MHARVHENGALRGCSTMIEIVFEIVFEIGRGGSTVIEIAMRPKKSIAISRKIVIVERGPLK